MNFSFVDAGLAPNYLEYNLGLNLQEKTHNQVVNNKISNTVLLLEHQAVFTAGKRTEDFELPYDKTPVIKTDRGGKITWHGPGQLVGYPIMKLPEPIDIPKFVKEIETALIAVIKSYGLPAVRVPDRSGVWLLGDKRGPDRKIAALGIRIAQKVTMHGFALNCNNDLRPFGKIIPCGIKNVSVTSLSEELNTEISPKNVLSIVKEEIIKNVSTA